MGKAIRSYSQTAKMMPGELAIGAVAMGYPLLGASVLGERSPLSNLGLHPLDDALKVAGNYRGYTCYNEEPWAISTVVAHFLHTEGVTGSNPVSPIPKNHLY